MQPQQFQQPIPAPPNTYPAQMQQQVPPQMQQVSPQLLQQVPLQMQQQVPLQMQQQAMPIQMQQVPAQMPQPELMDVSPAGTVVSSAPIKCTHVISPAPCFCRILKGLCTHLGLAQTTMETCSLQYPTLPMECIISLTPLRR